MSWLQLPLYNLGGKVKMSDCHHCICIVGNIKAMKKEKECLDIDRR